MISQLRALREYSTAVRNGESAVDHIWCYHVAIFARRLGLWYDTEAWAKKSTPVRFLHVLAFCLNFLLWWLVIARVIRDFDDLSISRIADGIALTVGGFLTFLSFVLLYYYRDLMTGIIAEVDEKFCSVPKDSDRMKLWWQSATKVYLLEIKLLVASLLVGLFIGGPTIIYALIKGQLLNDTVIPLSDESYTWEWWLQFIYQSLSQLVSGIYYSVKEFLALSLIYQVSALYRLQADNIMQLCVHKDFDPDEEFQRITDVFRELGDLLDLVDRMNRFLHIYLLNLFSFMFLMLAIAGVGIIVDSKSVGWPAAIISNMGFPSYCFVVLACWTNMGEYFTESVSMVENALYNCNWVEAPPKVQKLILLFMIRCAKATKIEAAPLFIANRNLLGEIMKKTYYFLTVLLDYID